MSLFDLEILEEAEIDINNAFDWYHNIQPKLAQKLVDSIDYCLIKIQQNPYVFQKIHNEFRQALVQKFPYVLVFEVFGNKIVIFALFHTSKHPNKKFKD